METSCINNILSEDIKEIDWKTLFQSDRTTLPVPFKLTIPHQEDPLICEKALRILPKKRLVAYGQWDEKPVVVKLFYERGNAQRHVKRELAGIDALTISGVPTPKLLFHGTTQDKKIQVLIFEFIQDSTNLGEIWHDKNSPEDLLPLMKAVTIELATQHVLGIIQHDLHLNNFLVKNKQIYTLDSSSINHIEEILSKEQSLEHLALFFSQLGVGTENLQEKLLQTYIKARSWLIKKSEIEYLNKLTREWTKKRWQQFEKKLKRNSSAFVRFKTARSTIMYDRAYQSAELENLFKNPELIFLQAETHILKAGRSSTVAKIKLDDRYFVIKRYNIKNIFHWLRRCLRSSRAENSWKLAQRLWLFGVPTAKPVAYIENNFLGLRGKSYYIMEHVAGNHVGDYFAKYNDKEPSFKLIAERVFTLFQNLAKLHLTHGDLKMTNILIEHERPVLIDLDGMTEHKTSFGLKLAFRKELKRFLRNWENKSSVQKLFEQLMQK